MLEIYVHGTQESGFLDLLPGSVLSVQRLMPAFDPDMSTGDFSFPLDIPLTGNNKRILGFAERLENFRTEYLFWRCDVYDDHFPEMVACKLSIVEKNVNLAYTNGTISITISGTKGLFGTDIRGKKLADLPLGGVISWTGLSTREFATALMQGDARFTAFNYIQFAPVAILNFFNTDAPTYLNEFLANDMVNNVVTATDGSWQFGRPSSSSPSVAATSGTAEYVDYRSVPFFTVKWLLRRVLLECGYTVQGRIMQETTWDDLFFFNNRSLEQYTTGYVDTNTQIDPRNHVPDMLVSDFVIAACQQFNLYPTFPDLKTIQLNYRGDLLQSRNTAHVDDIVSGNVDATYTALPDSNATKTNTDNKGVTAVGDTTLPGYTLDYQSNSNDQYPGDHVPDITTKNLVASVNTLTDLATIDIGRQLTTNDVAFVEDGNLYYVVANATSSPVLWSVWGEKLTQYIFNDGSNSVTLPFQPLLQYVITDATTGLSTRQEQVAASMAGSYVNVNGTVIKNDFVFRVFYISDKKYDGTTGAPMSFNHNTFEQNGAPREPYSLALSADTSIADLHKDWQAFLLKQELVKVNLLTDKRSMQRINNADKLVMNGVVFIPQQVYFNIPVRGVNEVDMIAV